MRPVKNAVMVMLVCGVTAISVVDVGAQQGVIGVSERDAREISTALVRGMPERDLVRRRFVIDTTSGLGAMLSPSELRDLGAFSPRLADPRRCVLAEVQCGLPASYGVARITLVHATTDSAAVDLSLYGRNAGLRPTTVNTTTYRCVLRRTERGWVFVKVEYVVAS